MKYTIIADQSVDEQNWLAKRREGITATDVGTIMTSGPAGWASLKRDKRDGSTFHGNAYTEHGHAREPFIIASIARRHDVAASSLLLAHPDNPRHMATPDAIGPNGLGEAKTTVNDWPTLDDLPRKYWWQVQWQMYVTGAERTWLGFELHENFLPVWMEPRIFEIARDDDAIADALTNVAEWEEFDPDTVPVELLPIEDLLADLAPIRHEIAAKKVREEEIVSEIRLRLTAYGKAATIDGAFAKANWSYPKPRKTFQAAAFKEAHPELYAEFTRAADEAPSPRLTITLKD